MNYLKKAHNLLGEDDDSTDTIKVKKLIAKYESKVLDLEFVMDKMGTDSKAEIKVLRSVITDLKS